MKALVAIALLFGAVSAQAAIESTDLTCQQIRDAIRHNGWQVVQTNGQPAGNKAAYATIYSDFGGTQSCSNGNAQTAWVKSSSGKMCPAGIVCVGQDDFFGLPTNLNYRDWL